MASFARTAALALSMAMSTAAMADQATMETLDKLAKSAPAGIPVTLNLADKAQQDFFTQQLRNADFAPERYPHLFDTAAPQPAAKAPRAARMLLAAAPDAASQPIQTFTSVGSPDNKNYTVTALSSVPGKPVFSMLALSLYDKNGKVVGTGRATSATQPPSALKATATATLAEAGPVKAVAIWMLEDSSGHVHHGSNIATLSAFPTQITNLAPMPAASQKITKICLGRTGTDCTYQPAGGSGSNVLIPVQGSISFADAIDTDPATQSAWITLARPDPGTGGGCSIASTDNFFTAAGTVIKGNTISWNLEPAHFQPATGCLAPNASAIYTLMLGLRVGDDDTFVTITSDAQPISDPSIKTIPAVEVWYSCLATGTRVTLADGKTRPIEKIKANDRVKGTPGGNDLVVNVLTGAEDEMIVLRSAKGHELTLTAGHPVLTPEGPILARFLRPGQKVLSQDGPVALTGVARTVYDGKVWNLNLDETAAAPDAERGSAFYANGILVGDHVMQFAQNRKHQRNSALADAPLVPREWQVDVMNAAKDDPRN